MKFVKVFFGCACGALAIGCLAALPILLSGPADALEHGLISAAALGFCLALALTFGLFRSAREEEGSLNGWKNPSPAEEAGGVLIGVVVLLLAGAAAWWVRTQSPMKSSALTAFAQREAIRRYPELGVAGSALNREFAARYQRIQREHPERLSLPTWPLRLARISQKAVADRAVPVTAATAANDSSRPLPTNIAR